MTSLATLLRLRAVQRRLRAIAEGFDDATLRQQFHPDISPLGWHIGHCAFIEDLWLRERIGGDMSRTKKLHRFYLPQFSPKHKRGRRLPSRRRLLAEVEHKQNENILLLAGLAEPLNTAHPLLTDEYLQKFIIQHHAQHLETMQMALQQRAFSIYGNTDPCCAVLNNAPQSRRERVRLPRATYRIGGVAPDAFDNELPQHTVEIGPFQIALQPVSNADYLAFLQAGGYHNLNHWDNAGRAWLEQTPHQAPEHWRCDGNGGWFALHSNGPQALSPATPVSGICYHEARAFAHWAGGRLPHEYEWEIGYRTGILEQVGSAWEWCDNAFFPYPGFQPFPYPEYSQPWFDGHHFTLRGGSRHTRAELRRPSFRNFHQPDKRYIFAGLRLAFDA